MHIVLAVTNDISTDQRVIRTAHSLYNMPAQITIIGRWSGNSMNYSDPRFQSIRMRIFFKKGPLFYAEYNFRLLIRLMMIKADLMVANDLDTLPAVFLASRIRKKKLVYDCHEFFTEVPELIGRRRARKVWEWLESRMLPHIRYTSTVSLPVAVTYNRKYGLNMQVIRNLPFRRDPLIHPAVMLREHNEKIILYQGALNMGRGLEMAIEAIQFTRNIRLVLIGTGDLDKKLRNLAASLNMTDRIVFTGRIFPDRLFEYTIQADLGISIEENLCLNYRYALPNKVFDYIQAEVPVLVSDMPEMRALVEKYDVGLINTARNAGDLGTLFSEILNNEEKLFHWKANLKKAAAELCWENEEQKMITLYRQALAGN